MIYYAPALFASLIWIYLCISIFPCSLVNPDILSELIGLIIHEPSKDLEESTRFRLPHIAAEILSCEVPQINEQVNIGGQKWRYVIININSYVDMRVAFKME